MHRSGNEIVYDVPGDLKEKQRAHTLLSTDSEKQQPRAWTAPAQLFPEDRCVPELVELRAAATPDTVAVVMGNQQLSYRELNQQANRLAHNLRVCGVQPDVLVGICVERSLDLVVGLLGIWKAGGAYVPLDPSYPAERLTFMLKDAGISILVTRQSLAARLTTQGMSVLCLDDDALLAQENFANPLSAITADNLAYVIFTSGSTGQPKGVQITHRSVLNLIYWYHQAFGLTSFDRTAQFASPSFDVTVQELWPSLTVGASVHIVDETVRGVPAAMRDWLVNHAITQAAVPTIMAEGLIALEWPTTTALRFLLTGGDTLHAYPPSTLPFTLINNYGPTEATVVATYGPVPSTPHASGLPSIGRPIMNTQIYILDEQLRQVPIGEPGELHIGGVGLAKGYLSRPELTAEKFIAHPFSSESGARLYKTGDLARYRPDGQIEFLGRNDQQVKIRGYRIELNEIVTVLKMHPAIKASLVVAREDNADHKRLVAYIILLPGFRPTASSLRNDLLVHLPEYMVPSMFVVLDAFPLTSSRKIDRALLPALTATNTLRDEALTAPTTPAEERLVAIMASVLGLEQVGIDDDFFALGGHSLLAAKLVTQINSAFAVDLPLARVFDLPTVRQLATEIEQLLVARLESMSEEEIMQLLQSEQSLT